MSRRLGSRDVLWLALVVGAVALLLVNVVFGVRGFDRPRAAPAWRVLEAPGTVLGWGGVALIALAIPYAVLTWLRGKGPGRVVSVLGALVVAFGIGGLAGALAHPAAAGGGRIAGTIAEFLRDAMGPVLAGVLFGLVCVPGLVLALVPLLAHATTGTGPRPVEAEGEDPARGWYPERRLGPDGLEIPMAFEGTDVGEIRLREPEPEPPVEEGPPAIASLPASSERRSRPILGIRFADETEPDAAAGTRPEALPVPDESRLPQGVRFAPSKDAPAEPEPEPEPEAPAVEPPVTEPPPPTEPIVAQEDVATAEPAPAEPATPPAAPTKADAPRRKVAPVAPE
ncbi:MAG TPA: hypothetical protein VND21_03960, partial [Planctomycetota bacterium]|nr:hypothetical protein [Planctomycetota bacterium]